MQIEVIKTTFNTQLCLRQNNLNIQTGEENRYADHSVAMKGTVMDHSVAMEGGIGGSQCWHGRWGCGSQCLGLCALVYPLNFPNVPMSKILLDEQRRKQKTNIIPIKVAVKLSSRVNHHS